MCVTLAVFSHLARDGEQFLVRSLELCVGSDCGAAGPYALADEGPLAQHRLCVTTAHPLVPVALRLTRVQVLALPDADRPFCPLVDDPGCPPAGTELPGGRGVGATVLRSRDAEYVSLEVLFEAVWDSDDTGQRVLDDLGRRIRLARRAYGPLDSAGRLLLSWDRPGVQLLLQEEAVLRRCLRVRRLLVQRYVAGEVSAGAREPNPVQSAGKQTKGDHGSVCPCS